MTVLFGRSDAEFWNITLAQVDMLATAEAARYEGAPQTQGTAADLVALSKMAQS